MWQIERKVQHLIQASSDHMMLTGVAVLAGVVLAIWVVCNGFGR